MDVPFFENVVHEAVGLGYTDFGLTPLTGEVFCDKDFMKKIDILEKTEGVRSYHFFTNFVLADNEIIKQILDLKKLSNITISIYGYDLETFKIFTQKGENQYNNLIKNLEYLVENIILNKKLYKNICITWKINNDDNFFHSNSDLKNVVSRLSAILQENNISINRSYNNWGGIINKEDIKGMNIKLKTEGVKKRGACSLLFYKNIILSDGRVNACACRDVNGKLIIGNINNDSLRNILSSSNKRLVSIIEEQQHGNFNEVCSACDFYRSIYKNYEIYKDKKVLSIKEAYDILSY